MSLRRSRVRRCPLPEPGAREDCHTQRGPARRRRHGVYRGAFKFGGLHSTRYGNLTGRYSWRSFIENDRFTKAPTATKTWVRTGAAAPGFEAPNVLPTLTRKAVEYIGPAKSPFFLYLPLSSPHGPIVPTPEWQGRSTPGAPQQNDVPVTIRKQPAAKRTVARAVGD